MATTKLTKDQENAIILVAGFIRKCNKNNIDIPKELIRIISIYWLRKLKFDREHCGEYVKFIDDYNIKIGVSESSQSMCLGNIVIDSRFCKKYEWTIIVNEISRASWMGFIDVPLPKNKDDPYNIMANIGTLNI